MLCCVLALHVRLASGTFAAEERARNIWSPALADSHGIYNEINCNSAITSPSWSYYDSLRESSRYTSSTSLVNPGMMLANWGGSGECSSKAHLQDSLAVYSCPSLPTSQYRSDVSKGFSVLEAKRPRSRRSNHAYAGFREYEMNRRHSSRSRCRRRSRSRCRLANSRHGSQVSRYDDHGKDNRRSTHSRMKEFYIKNGLVVRRYQYGKNAPNCSMHKDSDVVENGSLKFPSPPPRKRSRWDDPGSAELCTSQAQPGPSGALIPPMPPVPPIFGMTYPPPPPYSAVPMEGSAIFPPGYSHPPSATPSSGPGAPEEKASTSHIETPQESRRGKRSSKPHKRKKKKRRRWIFFAITQSH
ncbi:unnamed protein product [Strongylus vulgaris]|uniref:Uncharacterized protein n=1 Tax=Strongylus vulgaris TaxID=40348 RepID=A0A3P7KN86_STRVU|nr:unnamed protein product [Strongylus vulgaris]